jgi:hypothetical protein
MGHEHNVERESVFGGGGVPVVKLQCQLDMPTQNIAMFTGIPIPGEL